jgi:hypothetical protein
VDGTFNWLNSWADQLTALCRLYPPRFGRPGSPIGLAIFPTSASISISDNEDRSDRTEPSSEISSLGGSERSRGVGLNGCRARGGILTQSALACGWWGRICCCAKTGGKRMERSVCARRRGRGVGGAPGTKKNKSGFEVIGITGLAV